MQITYRDYTITACMSLIAVEGFGQTYVTECPKDAIEWIDWQCDADEMFKMQEAV